MVKELSVTMIMGKEKACLLDNCILIQSNHLLLNQQEPDKNQLYLSLCFHCSLQNPNCTWFSHYTRQLLVTAHSTAPPIQLRIIMLQQRLECEYRLKYSTYVDDVVTLLEAAWPWGAAHSSLVQVGGQGLYKVHEIKDTLIDAMKIVQVGKLVDLASMCMQVYCAFLCMLLHRELSFATGLYK